jgi:hypothetical protein
MGMHCSAVAVTKLMMYRTQSKIVNQMAFRSFLSGKMRR